MALFLLFIDDKLRGGHLTKYETIRFSMKRSCNCELNQRLGSGELYQSGFKQRNKNVLGNGSEGNLRQGICYIHDESVLNPNKGEGVNTKKKGGGTTSLRGRKHWREWYYQSY